MKRLLSTFFGLSTFLILNAQITGPEQDCVYSINICNENLTVSSSYSGNGYIKDIPDQTGCLINEENNSVWLRLEIDSSGQIVFDIAPLASSDYDFAVYNITNSGCQAIYDSLLFPIRCSYYAYALNLNPGDSITGLRYGQTLFSSGVSESPFLAPLDVLAGEVYAIVIDNFEINSSGFNIDLSQSTAKVKTTNNDTINMQAELKTFCRMDMESSFFTDKNELFLYFTAPVNTSNFSVSDFSISGVYSLNCVKKINLHSDEKRKTDIRL